MVLAGIDAVVVAGGDNGFNHLFVQPDIAALSDLRGRTLVADVADTGWSFVLYEILKRHGLNKGDYVDSRSRRAVPPLRGDARRQDRWRQRSSIRRLPSMRGARGSRTWVRSSDEIGAYQGTVPYVLRAWALANAGTLIAYLTAMIEGLRWALDPANRMRAIKLYADGLRLSDDMAAETYAVAADPKHGLARDAAFDFAGFETMLRLRAEFTGARLAPAASYLERSYYDRALATLEP